MTESQPKTLEPARAKVSQAVRRWLSLLLGVAGLAALAVAVGYLWGSYQHMSEREAALRRLKTHGYGWVSTTLKQIAERDRGDVEVIREIGRGTFINYFLADAEEYLNRWCELEPAVAEPRLLHLRLMRWLGRMDEALADGDKLVEIAPDDLDVQKEVILLMIQARHYTAAERNCRRLLAQNPEDGGLRYSLAECRHADGRDDEARTLLDAALKDDPHNADALILRAVLYCEAGQDGDAVPLLRRAKKEEPFWSVPRYYLSLALSRAGKAAEADKEMAESQELEKANRVIEDAQIQPENLDQRCEAAKLLIERNRGDEITRLISDVLTRRRLYTPAMLIVLGPELTKHAAGGKKYR